MGQSEEKGVKIKGQEEEEEKQFPVVGVTSPDDSLWKITRPTSPTSGAAA